MPERSQTVRIGYAQITSRRNWRVALLLNYRAALQYRRTKPLQRSAGAAAEGQPFGD